MEVISHRKKIMDKLYGSYFSQAACKPEGIRYVKKKHKVQETSLQFYCNSRNYASTYRRSIQPRLLP
jgi:hypothetical protein